MLKIETKLLKSQWFIYFLFIGAVHKVRHAIFGQFWPPPSVALCHKSRDPPKVRHTSRNPLFLVGLVQKIRTKALCTNSLSIVREGFCPGAFVSGLLSGRFCLGWLLSVPLLSEYICYNRKSKITLNFMFHMYDKKIYNRDVTNCHTFSDPLECDVLYGRLLIPW